MSDEELEAIRQRKLAALQDRALQEQRHEQQLSEAQTKTNVKMVKPQFAEQIEAQLIQLAASGRLKGRVDDDQLKTLLLQIQGRERERKVTFR